MSARPGLSRTRAAVRLPVVLSLALLAGCSSVPLKRDEPAVAAEYRVDADDQAALYHAALWMGNTDWKDDDDVV